MVELWNKVALRCKWYHVWFHAHVLLTLMRVCGIWTHVVCIHKARFPSSPCSVVRVWPVRLHTRLSCWVFTALWCSCFVVKLTFYFCQTPSWLWLVWTNSPVFTLTRVYTSWHNSTNNSQTSPYYGHVSSSCVWKLPYARICTIIKKVSQVMGMYSVLVAFVTQLCSPSNVCVCVWSVDTRVYTQSSLSVFTMLGTAVLSSPHPPSWLWLVSTTVQTVPGLHHITDTLQVCE